ncbi:MAG: DUF4332 domain-containing protein [Alphaproteobacteria bacterium]|nr:DUF4332 domain-containing protein [Alphaproteobacteria bacterium]
MANLRNVEGIGKTYAGKLEKAGVKTTNGLLKHGATRKGRSELAASSGCTERQILEWVNRADLFRIDGVGEEYSDLLEVAGVDSVPELAQRNAINLHQKMAEVNAAKRLVRQLPTSAAVSAWVAQAKTLPRVVKH